MAAVPIRAAPSTPRSRGCSRRCRTASTGSLAIPLGDASHWPCSPRRRAALRPLPSYPLTPDSGTRQSGTSAGRRTGDGSSCCAQTASSPSSRPGNGNRCSRPSGVCHGRRWLPSAANGWANAPRAWPAAWNASASRRCRIPGMRCTAIPAGWSGSSARPMPNFSTSPGGWPGSVRAQGCTCCRGSGTIRCSKRRSDCARCGARLPFMARCHPARRSVCFILRAKLPASSDQLLAAIGSRSHSLFRCTSTSPWSGCHWARTCLVACAPSNWNR
jgi:hypothetical protein